MDRTPSFAFNIRDEHLAGAASLFQVFENKANIFCILWLLNNRRDLHRTQRRKARKDLIISTLMQPSSLVSKHYSGPRVNAGGAKRRWLT